MKDFFSNFDQIRGKFFWIWSDLLKKFLTENFFFLFFFLQYEMGM